MSELSKAYEPQSVEDKWYDFWVKQGCFTADPARVSSSRPAYSIVIPPPNVTGVLHMGHVLNNTIQDILARKARMDGKEVLWLPGTDHAGIATERQVEKAVGKEEHKSKHDLGREEFIKRVWTWKEKHGGIIISQLKKLGCSCDWTRERFTMDPDYVACVTKVFIELYKKGLIYRGKRMVNWCPVSQTALSDEEVEMRPQKGILYHFKVEVAEMPGTWLSIATTRPETIPGDTAVAVNPRDARYAQLIGKHVVRPLPAELAREQKLIPIVGDEAVDFEFGTGVLKVTPAHDMADFAIGERHNLPRIDIMNPDATMNDLAGADLKGLERFRARKVAVEKLEELGALLEAKPYENNVGFSQRAGVPIEPRLSEQWFLKYPSVAKSKACVAGSSGSASVPSPAPSAGKMRFHPERWAKVYDHWLANIQDWCISRQLWWGHRIPVWSKRIPGNDFTKLGINEADAAHFANEFGKNSSEGGVHFAHSFSASGETSDCHVFVAKEGTTEIRALTTSLKEKASLDGLGFTQDPDVLDTWFSSWLWPFATMGWPVKTPELNAFYPTSDLVSGPDIIFFWVARMIMAGYEFMGDLPFRNVYFTGIVRDKQGRKMSKQLGNSPDPLDLIAKYGADAIRFGTMRSAPLGQDVLFDEKDVELGRNFCNKLWNACRFRQLQGGETQGEINASKLRSDDKWILLKLHQAIKDLNVAFAEYNFSEATAILYRFFWNEYCDWYVETTKALFSGDDASKKANALAVMDFVLSHTLRLFHPFLPFITEELWHGMGYAEDMPGEQGGRSILFAPWPKSFDSDTRDHYALDDCYLDHVNARFELITQGRDLRRQARVASNKKVRFVLKPSRDLPPNDIEVMKLLLNADPFEVNADYEPPKGVLSTKAEMGELYLPLEGLIDAVAETARHKKELEEIQSEIIKVEQKLANPNFVNKVPPAVLAEHRQRLEDWQGKRAHIQKLLDGLSDA
ncbi:MAG: valyl-tRNA synthetase [Verrucomicrobiota bacterium]|jgi:valyl-tRNA synthetase